MGAIPTLKACAIQNVKRGILICMLTGYRRAPINCLSESYNTKRKVHSKRRLLYTSYKDMTVSVRWIHSSEINWGLSSAFIFNIFYQDMVHALSKTGGGGDLHSRYLYSKPAYNLGEIKESKVIIPFDIYMHTISNHGI